MFFSILLSGGIGTRMHLERPKQYLEMGGRSILSYSAEALFQSEQIQAIQVVADSQWHGYILQQIKALNGLPKFSGFSAPGRNRQESIFNALQDYALQVRENDAVLIHDAVRPFLSLNLINRCIEAFEGHDGVLPVLTMRDTVYMSKDGKRVSTLLQREEIFAGQAPELFAYGKYYRANQRLFPNNILKISGSTEPAILAGMDIVMIPGDEMNFKVTTNADLIRFQEILANRGRCR